MPFPQNGCFVHTADLSAELYGWLFLAQSCRVTRLALTSAFDPQRSSRRSAANACSEPLIAIRSANFNGSNCHKQTFHTIDLNLSQHREMVGSCRSFGFQSIGKQVLECAQFEAETPSFLASFTRKKWGLKM